MKMKVKGEKQFICSALPLTTVETAQFLFCFVFYPDYLNSQVVDRGDRFGTTGGVGSHWSLLG